MERSEVLDELNRPPAARPVFTRTPGAMTVLTGLPEIGMGVAFFVTWVDPRTMGLDMVKFAMELMLLEFILVHSSGFMGLRASKHETVMRRLGVIFGFGLFYSMFVAGFCLALGHWRPMWTFWIVTAQRMAGDVIDPKPTDETQAWFGTGLAVNVSLYLGAAFLTVILPIPKLGVTAAIRDTLGINGHGLWEAEPHRVVVMAALYYFGRGLLTAGARPRTAFPPPVRSA